MVLKFWVRTCVNSWNGLCKALHFLLIFTYYLGGCDMVLGVQWLTNMGPIMWNFCQLKIKFWFNNWQHVLQVAIGGEINFIRLTQIRKTIGKLGHGMITQLFSIQQELTSTNLENHGLRLILQNLMVYLYDDPMTYDSIKTQNPPHKRSTLLLSL